MQQVHEGIMPMPDVDDFDPNADPGASRGLGDKQSDGNDSADEDVPLPPDVRDREPVEEPGPEPVPVEDPRDPPKQIV
jgi:hypothetical protein